MSANRRASRRPLARKRSKGQSIPLIALMIVVLVAMVGLSVDVGNTFSQERQAVAAANSASLSGMTEVLKGSTTNNINVRTAIQKGLAGNRINAAPAGQTIAPGQLVWEAYYLDRDGERLEGMPTIPSDSGVPPEDVAFVQVVLSGQVGTYFARVVGTEELPIEATSYAGVCPAGNGVYPIGVNAELINADTQEFREPPPPELDVNGQPIGSTFDWQFTLITDPMSPYLNKTQMRIPLHHKFTGSTSSGDNFGYLNWTGDAGSGSAGAIAERMWFPGNLSKGYKEIPLAQVAGLAAPDYRPNSIFEVGDWIWGDNDFSLDEASYNAIDSALQDHIQRGTRVTLPIFDPTVHGSGTNAKFKVVDLGSFVVTDLNNSGADQYIELVYLGDPTATQGACNVSAVPANPSRCCELAGTVDFYPVYQENNSLRVPVRYVVVQDVSGSMSANFAGLCDRQDGNLLDPPVQCTASTAADGVTLTPSQVSGTGSTYWWGANDGSDGNLKSQRRAIVSREALLSLVDALNLQENGNFKPAPFEDELALVWFNDGVSATGNVAKFNADGTRNDSGPQVFSANAAGLKAAINAKIPDRPQGGTNGAAGLYRAYDLLRTAPTRLDANNQPVQFRNVIVFVTDGVSNQYFHRDANNYTLGFNGDRDTYPSGSACASTTLISNIAEAAQCQRNDAGSNVATTDLTQPFISKTVNGNNVLVSRPITQMGEVSTTYLKALAGNGQPLADVFVVALSGATRHGMATVVSGSLDTNFKLVRQGDLLDDTFRDIYNRTANNSCPAVQLPRTGAILSTQFVPIAGLTHPNVGKVTLTGRTYLGETINKETVIRADPQNNNMLYYRFSENIPPGEYSLSAKVYFRWPDDVFTGAREYSLFDDDEDAKPVTVSATMPNGSLKPRTEVPLTLRLNGAISEVCPVN